MKSKYIKKKVKNKKCPKCKNNFLQKRSNQKFCSKKCKNALAAFVRYNNYVKERKKDMCSFCGFIPIDPCQLDIDHIDGNHNNNDVNNLQILCANCHRLKTKINNEGIWRIKKGSN